MDYKQLMDQARPLVAPNCKACPVCNGIACKNRMPGPGAKGSGDGAIRNFQKWQEIRLLMDPISDNVPVDTSLELFGRKFRYPFFAAPVGAVTMHFGPSHTDQSYNDLLVSSCAGAGIAAFTGDGMDHSVMEAACAAIKKSDGVGIPTIKPWAAELVAEKVKLAREAGVFAVAMDVDGSGLPFLKGMVPAAGRKNVEELREIIEAVGLPFIVKGVMTVKGAEKAIEAGAAAIVVSNHGGRVLDQCAATAEVLEEIAQAVKGRVKILVDGGIRSGADVFKALALGADAVMIARPFTTAVYGGGQEGVEFYVNKIGSELADTMELCGAATLADISRDMVRA